MILQVAEMFHENTHIFGVKHDESLGFNVTNPKMAYLMSIVSHADSPFVTTPSPESFLTIKQELPGKATCFKPQGTISSPLQNVAIKSQQND